MLQLQGAQKRADKLKASIILAESDQAADNILRSEGNIYVIIYHY